MKVNRQSIYSRIISSIRHKQLTKIKHQVSPLPDSHTYFCFICKQEFKPLYSIAVGDSC